MKSIVWAFAIALVLLSIGERVYAARKNHRTVREMRAASLLALEMDKLLLRQRLAHPEEADEEET